jgi:hypothetical protein
MTPEIMIVLSILFAALVEWIPMEIIPLLPLGAVTLLVYFLPVTSSYNKPFFAISSS